MRFIYNNQVYAVDNSNKCFKVYDLSCDTFTNKTYQTLEYKKCTPALKKFISSNNVYLFGDLFKSNQIQMQTPVQTTLQLFVQQHYINFVNEQLYYVQRKIDGFHAQVYILDNALSFDALTSLSDETFLEKENLFECEYLNSKYYVFAILREKGESKLEMNIKENFALCEKLIKQSINIDFKIKNANKQSNIIVVGYIEAKKKTTVDWIEYFKTLLDAKTSSTIPTDGFVLYKADKTVSDRVMYKLKPSNNTGCEFILKWQPEKQQYIIITVGSFRDFSITNATRFIKSEPKTPHAKLGGCEYEFKLPFFLNTMSHVYKPKLTDPLGEIAIKGELDGKYCECVWTKYNDSDPYPSRIVPEKVRHEITKVSHMHTSVNCYVGSLISFESATKEDITDAELYNNAPENYLNLFAGNNVKDQHEKPSIFVYQGSTKNFLSGLQDITKFKFAYIFQESLAMQINTFQYAYRQYVIEKSPVVDGDKKTYIAKFPNWFLFKRDKLQQIILKQPPFDILRVVAADQDKNLLRDMNQISLFDVIAHSAKSVEVVDPNNVIKGTPFEEYLSEHYVKTNTGHYILKKKGITKIVIKKRNQNYGMKQAQKADQKQIQKQTQKRNMKQQKHNTKQKQQQQND